jgi:hypothetical protein
MGSATVDEFLIRSYLSTAAEYGKNFYDTARPARGKTPLAAHNSIS